MSLATSGSKIFAGTYGDGLFLSTDNGSNWTSVNIYSSGQVVLSLATRGNYIFEGTGNGVFLSKDNGNSWASINTGLSILSINSLALSDNTLYAGINGDGIWKRPLSDFGITTGLNETQNYDIKTYPNPVNDILYLQGLKENTKVSITDIQGKKVLVNNPVNNQIDVSRLRKGIYLIEFETNHILTTKKFIKK